MPALPANKPNGIMNEGTFSDTDAAPDRWSNPQFEAEVRDTAYFMWEQDGRPEGREQEYWFRALEKCLRRRQADADLAKGPPPA